METNDCMDKELAAMGFTENQYRYSHILFMSGILLTEGILYDDKDKLETGMIFSMYSALAGDMIATKESSPVFTLLYTVAKTHQYICKKELDFNQFVEQIKKMQTEMQGYMYSNYKEIFAALKESAQATIDAGILTEEEPNEQ